MWSFRCPKRREIYVLDAGNSRVKVLDDETFAFKTHIVNEGELLFYTKYQTNRKINWEKHLLKKRT